MELTYNSEHRLVGEQAGQTDNSTAFRAKDIRYGRTVFVKAVPIKGESQNDIAEQVKTAEREAKTLMLVGEQTVRVPQVYDYFYDEPAHVFYIVMQNISGPTLRKKMIAGLSPIMAINAVMDICDTLTIMERYGLAHRDIKPENIIFSPTGGVSLIDFGSAVLSIRLKEGTVDYQAPEFMDFFYDKMKRTRQVHKRLDRSHVDIFSLGVILYEIFTGIKPSFGSEFRPGRDPSAWKIFIEPKEKKPELSDSINSIIVKCMQLDPVQRYHNANALKNELKSALYKMRKGSKRHDL